MERKVNNQQIATILKDKSLSGRDKARLVGAALKNRNVKQATLPLDKEAQ